MNDCTLQNYIELHAQDSGYGSSGVHFLDECCLFINSLKPRTVLDYGCGKGALIRRLSHIYPDIEFIFYDPAIPGYSQLLIDKCDLIICTDVLEHIPQTELPATLERMAGLSENCFLVLHHYAAGQLLPDGTNAHCTIKPPCWYHQLLLNFFDVVSPLPARSALNSAVITFRVNPQVIKQYLKLCDQLPVFDLPPSPRLKSPPLLSEFPFIQTEEDLLVAPHALPTALTSYFYGQLQNNLDASTEAAPHIDHSASLKKDQLKSFALNLRNGLYRRMSWFQAEQSYAELTDFYQTAMRRERLANRTMLFENYVRFLFNHGDLSGKLDQVFNEFAAEMPHWNSYTVLLKISHQLFKATLTQEPEGRALLQSEACRLLYFYLDRYGEHDLHLIPTVANFVRERGLLNSSTKVEQSSVLWQRLNKNIPELLANLSDKSVALVGNGPQELGRHSGAEIDAHDCVIRMNNYQLNDKFQADYGNKVNIWATCAPIPEDLSLKGNFEAVVLMTHCYSYSIFSLLKTLEHLPVDLPIYVLDLNRLIPFIHQQTGIYTPSNGLSLICCLLNHLQGFNVQDCFGFSFKEKASPTAERTTSHYFDRIEALCPHDYCLERIALNTKIFI
ncbi:MAG: glycosyltransferase family 29 protein [Succinivibrio sp.]|nr:glycosyltransferase family 29 protein [Succinivibrio sp.]